MDAGDVAINVGRVVDKVDKTEPILLQTGDTTTLY